MGSDGCLKDFSWLTTDIERELNVQGTFPMGGGGGKGPRSGASSGTNMADKDRDRHQRWMGKGGGWGVSCIVVWAGSGGDVFFTRFCHNYAARKTSAFQKTVKASRPPT